MRTPSLVHRLHNLGILAVVEITLPNEFCQVMTDLFTHPLHFPSQFCLGANTVWSTQSYTKEKDLQ